MDEKTLVNMGQIARDIGNGRRDFHNILIYDGSPETARELERVGLLLPERYGLVLNRAIVGKDPDKWAIGEEAMDLPVDDVLEAADYLQRMRETAQRMRKDPVHFHGCLFGSEKTARVEVQGLYLPFAVFQEGTFLYGADLPLLTIPGARIQEDSGFSERRRNLRAHMHGGPKGFDYRKASVDGMNMTGAYLNDAAMQGLELRGVRMDGSDQTTVDYSNANFYNSTSLYGAAFSNCDFTRADVTGMNVKDVKFQKCRGL